jgi:hypothetical protein
MSSTDGEVEQSTYNATEDAFHITYDIATVDIPEILRVVLVHGVWTGIIVFILLSMVFFSTSQQRHGPTFYLLSLSFVMVVANAALKISWAFVHMHTIFLLPEDAWDPWTDFHRAYTFVVESVFTL